MAFWTDKNTSEPLRQHRWFIRLPSEGLQQVTYAVKECSKPSYDIGVSEHKLLTHVLRYPTLLKWKPIEVKIASTAGAAGTAALVENLVNYYNYRTPNIGHQQIAKIFSGIMNIYQINADGEVIEDWELTNVFISSVNHGALSYENENIVDVTLTLQYDYATLNASSAKELDIATDNNGAPPADPFTNNKKVEE